MDITLQNGIAPKGRVVLPPSKSEAIRAALLLGICGCDPSRATEGFEPPFCEDLNRAAAAAGELSSAYVGESAALLRFLIPVQAALFGRISVRAEERLLARGMREAEECLGVSLIPRNGVIEAELRLSRSSYTVDCSRSSQFLSGLMIALPLMDRDCGIIIKNGLVSKPYADMTFDFVRLFGGRIERTRRGYAVRPSRYRAPERVPVTGDLSCAAVFEAMNILGARVEIAGSSENTRQPDGEFKRLAALDECDITNCPDLLPLLCAAACGKKGETVIRGTARLKTKESDRERGAAALINGLGGSAEVGNDCVIVRGSGRLRGGIADTMNDHRLAFAAAVMAMICDEPVTVTNAECVGKSAPGFWNDIRRLTGAAAE